MVVLLPEKVSAETLSKELKATEKDLNDALQTQRLQEREVQSGASSKPRTEPKAVRLLRLRKTTDSLVFAREVAGWIGQAPTSDEGQSPTSMVIAEAEWCYRLASLILQYPNLIEMGGGEVYGEMYLPLYHYLTAQLLHVIQQELQANQYHKMEGSCSALIEQCLDSSETCAFGQGCRWLIQLQNTHREVVGLIEGGTVEDSRPPCVTIVKELLRPFVQRIQFHFVDSSPERATSTRIDRLPEWLLTYVKDNILEAEEGSPWELIESGLAALLPPKDTRELSLCFWNEVIHLLRWVLTERDFFRHPDVAGPQSNPTLLYNATEHFLVFDHALREVVPTGQGVGIFGLMDNLVMADEDMRNWWIERERESVFSSLFEDDSMANVPKPLANHVSPRAEIFCALIRAVQWKASTLTEPGHYLRNVAVPLCSQFVDALHQTSTDLRNLLCQPARTGFSPIAPKQLADNINEWIEIINGTNLAARILLREGPGASQSDHDLARFGRSLERLVEVMIEEFASSFVETILMERAKFASYLMMASHLLASQEWDGDEQDLSVELKETQNVLLQLHHVCSSILQVGTITNRSDDNGLSDARISHFAPHHIQTHVMNRVADKFLEVVLDVHDTTPDLWQKGARIFAHDVQLVLEKYSQSPLVKRLLDIVGLLTSESANGLLEVLGGLVGASDFLDIQDFTSDGTIFDEAVLMLKAKGFSSLELQDAISILNRRRD